MLPARQPIMQSHSKHEVFDSTSARFSITTFGTIRDVIVLTREKHCDLVLLYFKLTGVTSSMNSGNMVDKTDGDDCASKSV